MQAIYNMTEKALGRRKDSFYFHCENLVKETQKISCSFLLLGYIYRTHCIALKLILALFSFCLLVTGGIALPFYLSFIQVMPMPSQKMRDLFCFLNRSPWLIKGLHWASVGVKALVACMSLTFCLFGSSSFSFISLLFLLVWAVFHIIFDCSVNLLSGDQKQLFSCLLLMLTSLLTIWFLGLLIVPLLPN